MSIAQLEYMIHTVGVVHNLSIIYKTRREYLTHPCVQTPRVCESVTLDNVNKNNYFRLFSRLLKHPNVSTICIVAGMLYYTSLAESTPTWTPRVIEI